MNVSFHDSPIRLGILGMTEGNAHIRAPGIQLSCRIWMSL